MSSHSIAEQITSLLRVSSAIDLVGDVTVTVGHAADLVAWTQVLSEPVVTAWRATDSGNRFAQVSAHSAHTPVHGHITAVLDCDRHRDLWTVLLDNGDLDPGSRVPLSAKRLTEAWIAAAAIDEPR